MMNTIDDIAWELTMFYINDTPDEVFSRVWKRIIQKLANYNILLKYPIYRN